MQHALRYAPYSHVWPARLYGIFPNYLIKGTISEKEVFNMVIVFWFSLQLSSETFLQLRTVQRDKIKTV